MSDYEQKRMKAYTNRRSLMDLGMGIVYSLMGIFFIFKDKMGVMVDFPEPPFSYIFGALCLLYGGFRIYRGIKKNYFN